MSESDDKKPGFFGRLFGRKNNEDEAQNPAPETATVPAAETPAKPEPEPEPESKDLETPEPATPDSEPAASDVQDREPAAPMEPRADEHEPGHATPDGRPEADEQISTPPPDMPALDDAEEMRHRDPGPPQTTPEWIEEHEAAEPEATEQRQKNWFQRLTSGLRRSSEQLTGNIAAIFTKRKLDTETLQDLEDTLIQADLGLDTAMAITESLARDKFDKEISENDVRAVLAEEVEKVLGPVAQPLDVDTGATPFVILMVGVNGSGKTTTIGKLAQKFSARGKSVLLAAGDTFRAAAIEQLQVWGERTKTPVITRPAGADASGLAFDAVQQAIAEKTDILIIDTAGRLQNREELMAELEKIIRVIKKLLPEAPHATLLTLDATTGQNALNQVEIFSQKAGVTGLVMTKLDGTARGGILVAIAKKFGLPVHFIGVGEGVDDLEPFEAADFAAAIAGPSPIQGE